MTTIHTIVERITGVTRADRSTRRLRNQHKVAENLTSEPSARSRADSRLFYRSRSRSHRRVPSIRRLERNRRRTRHRCTVYTRVPHCTFIGIIDLIVGDHFITSTGWFWCQAMSNGRELSSICPVDRDSSRGMLREWKKYLEFSRRISRKCFL